ncbi:hypothetical protein [Adhaeribacter soli]|uniref:Uncharacterized protein n=1 Tax=Adhaeribacter soli TaxID=2607655 RepID=A0A5N1IXW3_9BACT|nr:hypothetical protein [Adhaeribacter soli]KAA9338948.1 hypothetical protein F0P94_09160 [Adhaeribacter soli]
MATRTINGTQYQNTLQTFNANKAKVNAILSKLDNEVKNLIEGSQLSEFGDQYFVSLEYTLKNNRVKNLPAYSDFTAIGVDLTEQVKLPEPIMTSIATLKTFYAEV